MDGPTVDLAWLDDNRVGDLPLADLGCGPGWHLEPVRSPAVGLDSTAAMLRLARQRIDSPLVRASVGDLPFRRGALGGAIASRVHTHLPSVDNPLALADLHRCLADGAPVLFDVSLRDLLEGAGFAIESVDASFPRLAAIQAFRRLTLPDTVGTGMAVLICGLNPSIHSAEAGVGFVTGSNRFWPGALAAGLVSVARDSFGALKNDGVGMTDLVKRATRRADELTDDEYRHGLARVERLVDWLQPRIVCFVGLSGWRVAVDRTAKAGLQSKMLGGRPVYLMPSTSGLNAHCQLPDVIAHLTEVRRLSDQV